MELPQAPFDPAPAIDRGEPLGHAGAEADTLIVLSRGGCVRVWHNVCPHAGRRLDWAPGRFLRDGDRLVCSHHGAVFELDGGVCVGGPCKGCSLAAVPSEIRDGEVWIVC